MKRFVGNVCTFNYPSSWEEDTNFFDDKFDFLIEKIYIKRFNPDIGFKLAAKKGITFYSIDNSQFEYQPVDFYANAVLELYKTCNIKILSQEYISLAGTQAFMIDYIDEENERLEEHKNITFVKDDLVFTLFFFSSITSISETNLGDITDDISVILKSLKTNY